MYCNFILYYWVLYNIWDSLWNIIFNLWTRRKKEKTPVLVQIQNDMNNNPNNIQTSETKPHTDTYKFGDSNNGGFSSTTYYGNGNNGGFKSSTTYYSIQ